MGMSDYLETQILTHMLRTGSWVKPATIAVSLHIGDPGDTTAGAIANEVANANGYARVDRGAPLDSKWTAPGTTGLSDNTAAVTFNAPTGAGWGTVTHVALWDNATYGGGNLLISGPLGTPKTVNGGDAAPNFPIGALDALLT
jgi:hypothetical protein